MKITEWKEWRSEYPNQETWANLVELLNRLQPSNWHYFFDEPWAPWILRIETTADDLPSLGDGKWHDINLDEDGRKFGPAHPMILRLFTAASEIGLYVALHPDEQQEWLNPAKLTHCMMNTWGYSRYDESRAYMDWGMDAFAFIVGCLATGDGSDGDLTRTAQQLKGHQARYVGPGQLKWGWF